MATSTYRRKTGQPAVHIARAPGGPSFCGKGSRAFTVPAERAYQADCRACQRWYGRSILSLCPSCRQPECRGDTSQDFRCDAELRRQQYGK